MSFCGWLAILLVATNITGYTDVSYWWILLLVLFSNEVDNA